MGWMLWLIACGSGAPDGSLTSSTTPLPATSRPTDTVSATHSTPARPSADTALASTGTTGTTGHTASTGTTGDTAPCLPTASWGALQAGTLSHDGVVRTHQVFVPASHDCAATTLVIGVHGYYGSGEGFATTTANLLPPMEDLGWIGVFPDGLPASNQGYGALVTSFNDLTTRHDDGPDGATCTDDAFDYVIYDNCLPDEAGRSCRWGTSCADDAGYLRALVDDVRATYAIERVVLTGFSQGGQTVQGLTSSLADIVDVVMPVHGFAANGYTDPSDEVTLLQVWGTDDRVVDGNDRPSSDGMIYDGAEETAAAWAVAHRCDPTPTPVSTSVDGVADWACQAHANCGSGEQVISCAWTGEHVWPRSPGYGNLALIALLELVP